jgi:predicted acyl esterase
MIKWGKLTGEQPMATLNYDVEMRLDVKVPMRDGVHLSADIYLPQAEGSLSNDSVSYPL